MDAAQYAELFQTESREHLSAINVALLALERALTPPPGSDRAVGGLTDADRTAARAEAIDSLFRGVHTIKGMSATMGYDSVATLSHEMEALLDRLRGGLLAAGPAIMDLLFSAADALESSIDHAVSGRPAGARIDESIDALRALAASVPDDPSPHGGPAGSPTDPQGAAVTTARRAPRPTDTPGRRVGRRAPTGAGHPRSRTAPKAPPKAATSRRPARATRNEAPTDSAEQTAARPRSRPGAPPRAPRRRSVPELLEALVRIQFVPGAPLRGARAAIVVQRAAALGQVTAVTPAIETFRQDGAGPDTLELRILTGASSDAIVELLSASGDVAGVDVSRLSTSAAGNGVLGDGIARQRHVRIDLRRLDALMNLIGELVIARGRLLELTGTQDDSALVEAVADAGRLIGNLQDEIMTCRMVPVWQVFDRFPRLVRDAAHALGKQVLFEVEGKEIELDRSMLDEIGDPIVHLLRNAVDHGIELPAARTAAGKSAQGHLKLSATRDRSAVLIRVTDDGRGIDRGKVLARAVESGLVNPATTALSDEDVVRLIARPGFTTADQVTDLSGRGVGIDAVQTRVRALGGSVEIKSAPGQGTTVTARLPLTLAIMRALLARVGPESYAFPMAHVDETVSTGGAAFAAVRGQPVLIVRGEAIPYVRLRELVGLPGVPGESVTAEPEQHVIVVESGGRRAAIAVDELTGQQDIVVKQFDGVRGGAGLFSGATILGDGAPALIVDVSSLL